MFFNWKRKRKPIFEAVDDSKTVVYDYRQRHPWSSYRAVDYELYHKLDEKEMLPKLDKYLNELLAGNVDSGNSNMLDGIILSAVREGMSDIERQHTDHVDTNRRLIVSHKSNYKDIKRIMEAKEAEYNALLEEYKASINERED